jgi:hypothetical protein
MPLFKFNGVAVDIEIATIVAESPFVEARLEGVEIGLFAELPFTLAELISEVIGLESEIECEIPFVECKLLEAASIVSTVPFVEVNLKTADSANVVGFIPFVDSRSDISVYGVANVEAYIPFAIASGAGENSIAAIIPKVATQCIATVSLVAEAIGYIPGILSVVNSVQSQFAASNVILPFIDTKLIGNTLGQEVQIVSEIPFMLALASCRVDSSFSYSSETDVVLRHESSRRYI